MLWHRQRSTVGVSHGLLCGWSPPLPWMLLHLFWLVMSGPLDKAPIARLTPLKFHNWDPKIMGYNTVEWTGRVIYKPQSSSCCQWVCWTSHQGGLGVSPWSLRLVSCWGSSWRPLCSCTGTLLPVLWLAGAANNKQTLSCTWNLEATSPICNCFFLKTLLVFRGAHKTG